MFNMGNENDPMIRQNPFATSILNAINRCSYDLIMPARWAPNTHLAATDRSRVVCTAYQQLPMHWIRTLAIWLSLGESI